METDIQTQRLQNVLAHCGVASRRHAAEIIASGRVTVDGRIVRESGFRVDPKHAKITCDGRLLGPCETKRTIMLYKPVGVLSAMSDPFGGQTTADLLRNQIAERLVPVGRLDKDSEGLLILSNDGKLTLRLTHPRYEHVKTYVVRVAGRWNEDKLRILLSSIEMPDGYRIRPVRVEVVSIGRDNVHVLVFKLREGRKRQIRYMCSAAHLVVLSLKRVAIGALRLPDDLQPGAWRDLTHAEIKLLLENPSSAPPARPCIVKRHLSEERNKETW